MHKIIWVLTLGVAVSACFQPHGDADAGVDAGVIDSGATGGGGTPAGGGTAGGTATGGGGGNTGGGDAVGGGAGGGGEVVDAGRAGEDCDEPLDVPNQVPVDGGYTATFRVAPAADDVTVSCAMDGGVESVFRFELPETMTVDVSMSAPGGTIANVSVREADCTNGLEHGCVSREANGMLALRLPSRSSGTYFLVVELESGTFADVTLTVARPVQPATNDTCATATALTFVNDEVTFSGHTVGANNDIPAGAASPTCIISRPPVNADVVYSYTLTQSQDVVIDVLSQQRVEYFVRRACASTAMEDEVFCTRGFQPRTERLLNQQPGTYYVWISGPSLFFDGRIRLAPPTPPQPNALCSTPARLFADGGTTDVVRGTTVGGVSPAIDCAGDVTPTAPSAFYVFDLHDTRRVEATLRQMPSDAGQIVPGLAVRRLTDCQSDGGPTRAPSSMLGCFGGPSARADAVLSVSELDAGTYLLSVFGDGVENVGAFELEFNSLPLSDPPTNDDCSTAETIQLDGTGRAFVRGTTRGAANTHTPSCRSDPTPEVMYSISTPAALPGDAGYSLFALVRSENASELLPTASLQLTCGGGTSSELACRAAVVRDSPSFIVYEQRLPPATTYSLVIGGSTVAESQGPFSVQLAIAPQLVNDTCAGALPLTLATPVRGSLVGAFDDYGRDAGYGSGCEPRLSNDPQRGVDAVYAFVPPTTRSYTAVVRGPPGNVPMPFVMDGSCAVTSQCWTPQPASRAVTFLGVAGRPAFVVIEGVGPTGAIDEFFVEVN